MRLADGSGGDMKTRVLVAGASNLDRICRLDSAMAVGASVPGQVAEFPGGAGLNVATAQGRDRAKAAWKFRRLRRDRACLAGQSVGDAARRPTGEDVGHDGVAGFGPVQCRTRRRQQGV